MNGLPIEAHLGRTVGEVVPDLLPSLEPMSRHVLDTGEPVVEYERTGETAKAPGQQRSWLESWYPVRDTEGQVLGVAVIVQEITERKRVEAALQAKDVVLKEVHHRIKNHLQVISSLLDLQADALEDPPARAAFEDSQRRIQAMALIDT